MEKRFSLWEGIMRLAKSDDLQNGMEFSSRAMTLPNAITLGRALLAPVIVTLITLDAHALAFWLFIAAALSDFVDGFLAKYYGPPTKLGAYLDPTADKILIVSLCITLASTGALPLWIVILIVSRDLFIVGGIMIAWIVFDRIWIAPIIIGKATTCLQLLLLGMILADRNFNLNISDQLADIGIYMVAFMTILSGLFYIVQWCRRIGISPSSLEDKEG